jgi:hypothetical protein
MLPVPANLCVKSHLFRSHLDRRLYDRYHAPVTWELTDGEDYGA